MLKLMTEKMFNGIILLDGVCFNKENNIRTVNNISALYNNNPNGCFVIQDDNNRIIGYIFSRIEGNVGFLGPLAVHPDYRDNGLATNLISSAVNSLIKSGCKNIGVDIDCNFASAIGLFQKCNFKLSFPTISYIKTFPYPNISSEHILTGNEITKEMLLYFDLKFREEYCGYSLIRDLEAALAIAPEKVIFYCNNNSIIGFVFNIKEIYPYVYSGFLKTDFAISRFLHAYGCLQNLYKEEQLVLQINSRYEENHNLSKYGFNIDKIFVRMLYKDYEGIFKTNDTSGFVAHSWIQ